MNRGVVIGAVVILGLGAAGLLAWQLGEEPEPPRAEAPERSELLHPQRPSAPPVPGVDRPRPAPEPGASEDELKAAKLEAYAAARESGAQRPGQLAFRAMVDTYLEYNQAFVEAQAAEEGISVAEVHELTHFGFMVLETQRWPDVEELLEQPLTDEQRGKGEELMHAANKGFKDEMRELVAAGASEDERWALIEQTRTRYLDDYFALTGMNEDLLDELLAGDPARLYAPADTPPPDEFEPAPPPPPVEPRPDGPS